MPSAERIEPLPLRAPAVDSAAPRPTQSEPPAAAPQAPVTPTPGPIPAAAAPSLGQALAAQVLDMAGETQWIDQLAREISRTGSGDLRFRLTPETLGELKIEISQTDRGAVVRMSVSSEAAQAAIAEAQPRLLAEARAQGVRIADAQVDLGAGQQSGREGQRQQSTHADAPMRVVRNLHPEAVSATPEGRRTERYA